MANLWLRKPVSELLADSESGGLKRTLGATNLVLIGIGAIIGAGLFVRTASAAANSAGPSVTIAFIIGALGCAFAGLCYAEFASMIPISGSAYTYSYATMGEFMAWIIAWNLVLEYALGAATVSIAWSEYFNKFIEYFISPKWVVPFKWSHSPFQSIVDAAGVSHHGYMNVPALVILSLITWVLIRGIQQSASVNGVIVIIKLGIVILVILFGWQFIKPENHTPYIPAPGTSSAVVDGVMKNFLHPIKGGWGGIVAGAGTIFFAFIGFDAVSTTAQEAKNPKRDMPIGIIGSLVICTILFILYSYVLTGIVNYKRLDVAAPLSLALDVIPYPWLGVLMNLAVIAGLTSVILVMLLGQSRVFYSMSADGLLPKLFSDVHPKFRTPWRSNLLLMVFVSLFSAFAPLSVVGNMTSIGTLFAFVLVCAGIWIMRRTHPELPRPFKTPLVPLVPILGIICNLLLMSGLGWSNWARLFVWLALGFLVYFGYSRHHSHLQGPAKAR